LIQSYFIFVFRVGPTPSNKSEMATAIISIVEAGSYQPRHSFDRSL
jgi:hypothetical protein